MTVTVSLLNMKGGVGKTTLSQNLAWYAAYGQDMSVLVVDLDPQFNASQCLLGVQKFRGQVVEGGHPTIVDIFEADRPRLGRGLDEGKSATPIMNIRDWGEQGRIDLIASRLEFAWTMRNAAGKERLLRNYLARSATKYDLVIIDCPPTESLATHAAYLSSDCLLVPVKPEFLAAIGLPLLASSLQSFRETHDHPIEVAGIVFNDVRDSYENARAKDDVRKLALEHGWYVFRNELTHSDSYPKGARNGTPIFATDYARSTKVDEFLRFGREFLERTKATIPVSA